MFEFLAPGIYDAQFRARERDFSEFWGQTARTIYFAHMSHFSYHNISHLCLQCIFSVPARHCGANGWAFYMPMKLSIFSDSQSIYRCNIVSGNVISVDAWFKLLVNSHELGKYAHSTFIYGQTNYCWRLFAIHLLLSLGYN